MLCKLSNCRTKETVSLVFSFDIDGTLEIGDPPGPITLNLVRNAQKAGHIIGSCSDRTLSEQESLWKSCCVQIDFVSLKYQLTDIRKQFSAVSYIHIGDSHVDRMYAEKAGFIYVVPDMSVVKDFLS